MHFTASIHTGSHTLLPLSSHAPVAIESKDISTRAWLERDCQCEHWPQSSYGSAGLEWGYVAPWFALPATLFTSWKWRKHRRSWSGPWMERRIWMHEDLTVPWVERDRCYGVNQALCTGHGAGGYYEDEWCDIPRKEQSSAKIILVDIWNTYYCKKKKKKNTNV